MLSFLSICYMIYLYSDLNDLKNLLIGSGIVIVAISLYKRIALKRKFSRQYSSNEYLKYVRIAAISFFICYYQIHAHDKVGSYVFVPYALAGQMCLIYWELLNCYKENPDSR